MADAAPATVRYTLRFLTAALLGSEIVLLVAVSAATTASGGFKAPPVWAVVLVGALGIAAAVLVPLVGYRLPAITPGTPEDEARGIVVKAVQSSTILRFALSEAVAVVSVALSFVVGHGGAIVCLIGVAVAIALGVLHVWPSDRVLTRTREALEREDGQSYLDDVLDSPPPSRRA